MLVGNRTVREKGSGVCNFEQVVKEDLTEKLPLCDDLKEMREGAILSAREEYAC